MVDGPQLPQTSSNDRNISVLGVQALNAIVTAIQDIFPQGGSTSSTATGGAATLPANPVKFLTVTLPDGTQAKVALYGL